MEYNRLGRSGLKVSELSFGSWLTFGKNLDKSLVKSCMKAAFDSGVNFFDNAEAYAKGNAESLMGEAIKEFRREDLVISTKIYFGGNGPNDTALNWKHIVEGTKNSLKRLKLQYVDLLYCHRPDPTTPLEETVRAMDHVIRMGYAFYWGTSEWPADKIEQAFKIAADLRCLPPTMEQPQYNMFHRERVEREYKPLYEKHGLGITTWSPLASGILTGKYNETIPKGSRLQQNEWLVQERKEERIAAVRKLAVIARELDCTLSQLALSWCMANPNVSSVITGATSLKQIKENMGAVAVNAKMTPEVLKKIDAVLGNKP